MVTVEVFKTNVNKVRDARQIIKLLLRVIPHGKVNFDLTDCDRILRIETCKHIINTGKVTQLLKDNGYYCEVLQG